ncbi:hypothetical protein [Cobetia marina]|uniref:hypothetical protein n=1 Tax=Cobetia marina TaxID=28258 RepID=UPI001142F979|nr:hypothetical protein [Cobetia marina]GED43677.1 hypothetical protein HHA02_30060 [Cobetia marina]
MLRNIIKQINIKEENKMSILPVLDSPNDLLMKLCRESMRTYTAKSIEEVSDHFFNFCITAHAHRDWIIKYSDLDKKSVHCYFNQYETLRMCRDIANASKHFGLDRQKPSSVLSVQEKELSFRPMTTGEVDPKRLIIKPSLIIISENGTKVPLKFFMEECIESILKVLKNFSIEHKENIFHTKSLDIKVGRFTVTFI